MGLYIENLSQYKDYIITIAAGNTKDIQPISGIILNNAISFDMVANLADASGSDFNKAAKGAAKAVASKIPGLGDYLKDKIDANFNSLIQSAQEWRGSSKFSFDVEFAMFKTGTVGTGTTDTFQNMMFNMAKYTQTKSSATDAKQETYLYDWATYNEAVLKNDLKAIENLLITVKIGRWFKSRYLLCKGMKPDFTTYVDNSGSPVYCKVSASFETYRDLNATEWSQIVQV